jgi:glycosyltransferase involved in cell wall biosynthesis
MSKARSSNKPTLLYMITKANLGGAQGNVLDLIRKFDDDYDVHLVCGEIGALTEDAEKLGVPIHIIKNLRRNINIIEDVTCVRDTINLIRRLNPSIIHAHSSKAGVVARISSRLCGVPSVFTAHGWGFSPGTPRLRRAIALLVEKVLVPITSRIICVSESDRQLALKLGVGNRKVLNTVRYGIYDTAVTLAQPAIQSPRLIMVARFNEQKDQATLLKAIAQIPDFPGHVDFVGSGPALASCKALAETLGVSQSVSFLGDRRDVPDLLAQSQIFILATHYEGLPISILEAMRGGLPVIASSVNGIPEEVEDGVTGLVVPPRDPIALADAIKLLVESPQRRQLMGKAARQRFEQEFTVDRMVRETGTIYLELLGDQSPKAKTPLIFE